MHAGQGKTRELGMIKLGREPSVHGVALLAGGRKLQGAVVRSGLGIILGVASDALCRQPLELADRQSLVTFVAGNRRMRADQGKTILVILHVLDGDLPSSHRVAVLTLGSQLPLVNIRMAVGALRAHIGEDQTGVAFRAGRHVLVKTPEGKRGPIVVEFQNLAERLPGDQGVAVLTRQVQGTMRASGYTFSIPLAINNPTGQKHQDASSKGTSMHRAHKP